MKASSSAPPSSAPMRNAKQRARKQKGSKGQKKARRKVARIADRRNDCLHKLTTRIISENHVLCVESLSMSAIIRWRKP
jgi:putative transposase